MYVSVVCVAWKVVAMLSLFMVRGEEIESFQIDQSDPSICLKMCSTEHINDVLVTLLLNEKQENMFRGTVLLASHHKQHRNPPKKLGSRACSPQLADKLAI